MRPRRSSTENSKGWCLQKYKIRKIRIFSQPIYINVFEPICFPHCHPLRILIYLNQNRLNNVTMKIYCCTHLYGKIVVHIKNKFFTQCILCPTCTAVHINTFRELRSSVFVNSPSLLQKPKFSHPGTYHFLSVSKSCNSLTEQKLANI